MPRVSCTACGKTTQTEVPWAREGSGFTLLFEALALSLCKELPVAQAASQLRVQGHRLWRRIQHYVKLARAQDDMSQVRHIGIDETSVKKGQHYITVVHDLQAKRLLFATPGRDHQTVQRFARDLQTHGGRAEQVVALRQVYEAAAQSQSAEVATEGLRRWVSWARRSRLKPFKRLAKTLTEHWEGVLAGMLKARTNAFVDAMNGLLQQAKRAARGFRTTDNFIAMAYLRMSKLAHLPQSRFAPAKPRHLGIITHSL